MATNFKDLNIAPAEQKGFRGDHVRMDKILNREITIHHFQIKPSKHNDECLYMQIEFKGDMCVAWTGSKYLQDTILKVPKDSFPIVTTIIKNENKEFQFT